MKIGFYYHVPAIEKEGSIWMPGYLGCFIDSLAGQCEHVICFLHSPNLAEAGLVDYRITSANVKLVNLGPRGSTVKRTLKPGPCTSSMLENASGLDLLLIRGPSPLLPAMAAASPVPTALLLVGDYVSGVNDLPQPRWRRELIRVWSHGNKWAQTRVAKRSLTFVNSHKLFEELEPQVPNLVETRTTTLTEDSFFNRPDTCLTLPVRLLYVGRMDRTKGLLEMVEAVFLLVQAGEDVALDLVGWPEPGDPVLEDLPKLTERLNVSGRVKYLGSRAMGPELFACYRAADIYLVASLASEGFPRTIWEAMANSLPVVATWVGSIPAFVEGAAVLVQPANPASLAEGVTKLIHDPGLRQQLITRGRQLALYNTLEIQAKSMVKHMEAWLKVKNG